jgi:hypothetical protein
LAFVWRILLIEFVRETARIQKHPEDVSGFFSLSQN